ncbi:hypothetical protein BpHYR1_011732, partial [Brachionus plicatilis]
MNQFNSPTKLFSNRFFGWYIHRFVPDQNINVTFKFANDTVLNAGEKLKVLSNRQRSSSMHDGLNRPPRPIKTIEKVITAYNIDNWGTYSKFSVTKLINQDGVDKAVLTQSLLKLPSSNNLSQMEEIPLPEGSELGRNFRTTTSKSTTNLNELAGNQMVRARSVSKPCCPETTTTTTTKTTTTSTTQQTTTTTTKNCCPDQLVTAKPPIRFSSIDFFKLFNRIAYDRAKIELFKTKKKLIVGATKNNCAIKFQILTCLSIEFKLNNKYILKMDNLSGLKKYPKFLKFSSCKEFFYYYYYYYYFNERLVGDFVRFLFSCFCFLFSIFATKPLKDSNHDQVELGEQKANNLSQNRSEPLQRWTSIFVTSSSHLLVVQEHYVIRFSQEL